MQEDKLSIRVNIADRYYPLKIERKDEENIRKAAKKINEKIFQYKKKYSDKDLQDFLAMAALQFVTQLIEKEESNDMSPIIDYVKELNEGLDVYLQKEKDVLSK
jgi:cell division protein ZapA